MPGERGRGRERKVPGERGEEVGSEREREGREERKGGGRGREGGKEEEKERENEGERPFLVLTSNIDLPICSACMASSCVAWLPIQM